VAGLKQHSQYNIGPRLIVILQAICDLHSTYLTVLCKYDLHLYELLLCKSLFLGNPYEFCLFIQHISAEFPHLLESPGFLLRIPGPGKSWKITLVLESPGNYSLKSWKSWKNILESRAFFWRFK